MEPQRQTRIAALVAALLAVAPHVPLLLGTAYLYYEDHARFSTPMLSLAADAICHGRLPLWNPYGGVGAPLMADSQTLAMHPASLIACALAPSHALGVIVALHLGLLAAGTAVVLRALDVHPGIAAGAGAACALAGPAPSLMTEAPYLLTLACFPWVVHGALRLARGGAPAIVRLAVWLALAAIGGDVPGAMFQGLIAAGVALAVAGPRALGRAAAAGAAALLIGAVGWAPLLWYVGRSVRSGGIGGGEAGQWSMHPAELLGLVVPNPVGLPLPENTFLLFGRPGGPRLFVHSYYVGALLAGLGLFGAVRHRREPPIRALAVAALVLLIAASGSTTPLWPLLQPLFRYFRYPSKVAPYGIALLAMLGAVALSRGAARATPAGTDGAAGPGHGRAAAVAALATGLLAGALAALGPPVQGALAARFGAQPEQIAAAAGDLRSGGLRAAVIALLGAAMLRSAGAAAAVRFARHAPLALGALLAIDGGAAGAALSWTIPAPVRTPAPAWLPPSPPWGPRVMRAAELDRTRLHRDEIGYLREVARLRRLLQPNANVEMRVGALEGYGLALGEPMRAMAGLFARDPARLAEIAAVDVALVPASPQQAWVRRALREGRVEMIARLPEGAVVLRPTRALPRAFSTTDFTLVPDGGEAEALLVADPRRGPVVTSTFQQAGGHRVATDVAMALSALPRLPSEPVAVRPVAWEASRMRFEVDRPEPALLVVADALVEGWHASIDGGEVPILRANLIGRAVAVPAGRHQVTMWFGEPVHRLAAACTIGGLPLGICGALAAAAIRRRRGRGAAGSVLDIGGAGR